jgi:hypothetical protein
LGRWLGLTLDNQFEGQHIDRKLCFAGSWLLDSARLSKSNLQSKNMCERLHVSIWSLSGWEVDMMDARPNPCLLSASCCCQGC